MLAPAQIDDPLYRLLGLTRLPTIVDVGASGVDGPAFYHPMLAAGLCDVIGFEPDPVAIEALRKTASPREQYLPYTIGTGEPGILHVTAAPGCTSLLPPDEARLPLLNLHEAFFAVKERIPVQTVRLDAVSEIGDIDFIKLDIQGAELDALCDGITKMQHAVMVQIEVSYFARYVGQPGFSEVDDCLRGMGFIPHCFLDVKRWPIAPASVDGDDMLGLRQVIEAEMVYVRDWTVAANLTLDQWGMLAFLAHHLYQSYDLALRAICRLAEVGVLPETAGEDYAALLRGQA